jgi:hypothetical protein
MRYWLGVMLACLMSSGLEAKGAAEWKEAGNAYKSKMAVPVRSMAVGAVNVDVGVHLERLTLLSGEGHTGKKVASGLLAGALTLSGMGAGIDTASREPIEEHLTPDDAKKIAAEVAQLVSEHFKKLEGLKVYAGDEVTASPFYQTVTGQTTLDINKKGFQEGRWGAEYFFGYYSTPAGNYKYRPLEKFSFSDKNFSPVVRQSLGVDTVAQVNVFLVNTRKDFRIHEMSVKVTGLSYAGQKGGDLPTLTFNLNDAGAVAIPLEGKDKDKDNYGAWLALKPQFEAQLDVVVAKIRAAIPSVPAEAASATSAGL